MFCFSSCPARGCCADVTPFSKKPRTARPTAATLKRRTRTRASHYVNCRIAGWQNCRRDLTVLQLAAILPAILPSCNSAIFLVRHGDGTHGSALSFLSSRRRDFRGQRTQPEVREPGGDEIARNGCPENGRPRAGDVDQPGRAEAGKDRCRALGCVLQTVIGRGVLRSVEVPDRRREQRINVDPRKKIEAGQHDEQR